MCQEKYMFYRRAGEDEITPLYTMADTKNTLKYIQACGYDELIEICGGIKVKFVDAGPDFPVYVDSHMVSEATRLYDDDLNIYGDAETR